MTSSSCGSNPFWCFFLHTAQISSTSLVLLLATYSLAQQAAMNALPDAPSQSSSPTAASSADQTPITIPSGTRLTLVLSNSVDSRKAKSGDQISAQVTAPVILNNEVVIPAGTFVQGRAQKLTRRGSKTEMLLQSASLVFPDGYIANAGGPVNIESEEWTALNNPSPGSKAAIILVPLISMPLGALIGHAADSTQTSYFAGMPITRTSHKGLVIGTAVGFVGGLATSFTLMARSHSFFIEGGAPMSMTLPQPVTLSAAQVRDAVQSAPAQPPVVHRRPPPATWPNGGPVVTGPGSCTAGQESCQGSCVDSISFMNDSANCGRCGNRCSLSETCTGGFCSCAPGYTSCMGQCVNSVNFITDAQNCGSCGNSCSAGESCLGGTCRKTGP